MTDRKKGKSTHASPRNESVTKRTSYREDWKLKRVEEIMQSDVSLDEQLLIVNSSKRTKKLAGGLLPETEAVQRLTEQLQVRDRYIEVLKSKLIEICVESLEHESVASKDRSIQSLMTEKTELLRKLHENEAILQQNQLELDQLRQGINSEKENLEQKVEVLTEETERLKGELSGKQALIASMKSDLVQLSTIIEEMTTLNNDLNEKITVVNGDMEKKSIEFYQAMSKAQHIEEVEKTLMEQIDAKNKLEEKVQKMSEGVARLQELEEVAREVKAVIGKLPGNEEEDLIGVIKGMIPRLEVGFVRPASDAAILKDKVKQLEMEMRGKNHELTRATTNEASLRTRLTAQLVEFDQWKKENLQTIDRLNKTISTLKKGFKGIEERAEKMDNEHVKLTGEVAKLTSKISTLQTKLDKSNESIKKTAENDSKSQQALKEIQKELLQLKIGRNLQDSALSLREQKVKQDQTRLKALSDQLWKKDTELLKKTAEIMKLEEAIGNLKNSIQMQQTRNKTDSVAISRIFEEKDKEIAALKSLLRHPKVAKMNGKFEDLMTELAQIRENGGDFESFMERLEAYLSGIKGQISSGSLGERVKNVLGVTGDETWSVGEFVAIVRKVKPS